MISNNGYTGEKNPNNKCAYKKSQNVFRISYLVPIICSSLLTKCYWILSATEPTLLRPTFNAALVKPEALTSLFCLCDLS